MSKYTDMENTVRKLREQIKEYDKKIEELEELSGRYYCALFIKKDDTKKGNRFFIAAGVLLVLMLIGTFFGYGLEESDYIVVGGVFAIGLVRKIIGWSSYLIGVIPYGGTKKARKEKERISAEIQELRSKRKDAEKKLNELTTYDGRNWNLETFRATPENVSAMERDLDRLFMCLWLPKWGDWSAYKDLWICKANVKSAGFQEMGNSGSWKLQVAQAVIKYLYQLNLRRGVNYSGHWEDTLKETMTREPQTQEEKEYLKLAGEVAVLMLGHLIIEAWH